MRIAIVALVVLLGSVGVSFSDDRTADSCSAADIQQSINESISTGGGTVRIPACEDGALGSTWSDGDYVCFYTEETLRILGAGQNSTVLKYANGAGPPASASCGGHTIGHPQNAMVQAHGAGFKEIGHLTLSGSDDLGMTTGLHVHHCEGMDDVRVHHMSIVGHAGGTGGLIFACVNPAGTILIDHIHVGEHVGQGGDGYGMTFTGPNNIALVDEPPAFGTDNGVFIEDCTFNKTYHPIAGFGPSRLTIRHNHFGIRTSAVEHHGPSFSTTRCCEDQANACDGWGIGSISGACEAGGVRAEVYDNTFDDSSYAVYIRTGYWIVTDNIIEYDGYYPVATTTENLSKGSGCTIENGCPQADHVFQQTQPCRTDTGCYYTPRAIYVWGNTYGRAACNNGNDADCVQGKDAACGLRVNQEMFFRAPQATDPIVTSYTKFQYPHPLQSCQPPSDCSSKGGICCDNVEETCPTGNEIAACDCSGCCRTACVPETFAPVRSNGQPTDALTHGTTETALGVTTDETATCRYSTSAGVDFSTMTDVFSNTNATTHSVTVSDLADGGSYRYYVRCQDTKGNTNADDFEISFSVATPPPLCTSVGGNCKDEPCDEYDDCRPVNGVCDAGHCCLGTCAADTTPPMISNVAIAFSGEATAITWDTNEAATSRVDFGLTNSYGNFVEQMTPVQSHALQLQSLTSNSTYYFKITSIDRKGNTGEQQGWLTTPLGWITPTSIVRACGGNHENFIDGNRTTEWAHYDTTALHEVVIDLGEVYTVEKIRLWHRAFYPFNDIAEVFVSQDTQNWGQPVGASFGDIHNEPDKWQEFNIIDTKGRYIKLTSTNGKYLRNWYEFEALVSNGVESIGPPINLRIE